MTFKVYSEGKTNVKCLWHETEKNKLSCFLEVTKRISQREGYLLPFFQPSDPPF